MTRSLDNANVLNDINTYVQAGDYFTYGGTADVITLTSSNAAAVTSLTTGMRVRFLATAANTGATTINVDGTGAVSCVTPTGSALPADFIRTGVITECEYDGSNFVVNYSPLDTYNTWNYQPTTSLGIGVVRLMRNDTVGDVADQGVVDGADLSRVQLSSDLTTWLASGAVISGTWVNVEGGIVGSGNCGHFVRVS